MSTSLGLQVCERAFARGLGFESYDDLMDASQPAFSPDGELWFIAALPDGHWLAWPFPEYDSSHQFESYENACEFVSPSVLAD